MKYVLFRSFALLGLVLSMSSASSQEASSDKEFALPALSIRAPSGASWTLSRKSDTSVAFTGTADEIGSSAMVSMFNFPPPYDRESLLKEVKRNVNESFLSAGKRHVINSSYDFTEERGYPCTKVTLTSDLELEGAAPGQKLPAIHDHMLLCRNPNLINTGFLVGYSYLSHKAGDPLASKATDFIEGVQVTSIKDTLESPSAVEALSQAANQNPVNALWNDRSGLGIWIYERSTSCAKEPYQIRSFLVIGPNDRERMEKEKAVTVNNLKLCTYFEPGSTNSCIAGIFRIEFDKKTRDYTGAYQVVFADGTKRLEYFRAQYCPPRW